MIIDAIVCVIEKGGLFKGAGLGGVKKARGLVERTQRFDRAAQTVFSMCTEERQRSLCGE